MRFVDWKQQEVLCSSKATNTSIILQLDDVGTKHLLAYYNIYLSNYFD